MRESMRDRDRKGIMDEGNERLGNGGGGGI